MNESTKWGANLEGRVLVLKTSGIVSLASQMDARHALVACVKSLRPGAVLVDLRSAALVMTPREWAEMSRPGVWSSNRVELPVAYLISEEYMECGRRLCSQMLEHGLLRRVFTEREPAYLWCSFHAHPKSAQWEPSDWATTA